MGFWGGSASVTVCEGGGGGGGVVSEDSRCLSRKSELALTQETDEQCVRALWFMDRTQFSGFWGFHWNKRRNSLLRNNWQLCQFTATLTVIVQMLNCQATWEKGLVKRREIWPPKMFQVIFVRQRFTSSYLFNLYWGAFSHHKIYSTTSAPFCPSCDNISHMRTTALKPSERSGSWDVLCEVWPTS